MTPGSVTLVTVTLLLIALLTGGDIVVFFHCATDLECDGIAVTGGE